MRKLIMCVAILLSGCVTSSGIVSIGEDTYMISRTEKGFIGSSAKVKAEAFKEANEFCVSQGKKIQVVRTTQKDMVPYHSDAQAEIEFMCLSKGDIELVRPKLKKEADVVIEQKSNISLDVKTKDNSDKINDVYTELLKLDDLRKKGIITEEEFEAQKKKILRRN